MLNKRSDFIPNDQPAVYRQSLLGTITIQSGTTEAEGADIFMITMARHDGKCKDVTIAITPDGAEALLRALVDVLPAHAAPQHPFQGGTLSGFLAEAQEP